MIKSEIFNNEIKNIYRSLFDQLNTINKRRDTIEIMVAIAGKCTDEYINNELKSDIFVKKFWKYDLLNINCLKSINYIRIYEDSKQLLEIDNDPRKKST